MDDFNKAKIPKPVKSTNPDDYKISMGKAQAFVSLEESVSQSILEQIQEQMSEKDIDEMNANVLWIAFVAFSKGALIDLSSDELHSRIHQWAWPSGESGLEKQRTLAMSELRSFTQRAQNLGDASHPRAEAMAASLFRKLMPQQPQKPSGSPSAVRYPFNRQLARQSSCLPAMG